MLNTESVRNPFCCFFRKISTNSEPTAMKLAEISLFHLWRQIRFKDEIRDILITNHYYYIYPSSIYMSKLIWEPLWYQNRNFRHNCSLFDQFQQLDTLMSLYSLLNYNICLGKLVLTFIPHKISKNRSFIQQLSKNWGNKFNLTANSSP